MQRAVSTYLYVHQKLTPATLAEFERVHIPYVELFCARAHFDYRAPEIVRELADWLEEHDVAVLSLHAPTSRDSAPTRESGVPISISDPERVRRLDAVDEVKRAIDVAERIPFRYLTLHLGASREAADPRRYHAAFNSLEHLVVFAKQRGVTIALENTPGELASPSNLRHFIQDTRLDVRVCFDTGHAHMEDGVGQSFETLRDLVVTAHLSDNHGEKDEHLLPYDGTIDWAAAVKEITAAPAAAGGLPMVLELKENAVLGRPLEQIVAVFDKFEEALAAKT